ncbi:MAG: LytTR family DNA-binding domain-containing protein [Bacteroidales bacterium]|jgi:hypothetical protein|nr:LytTR family DNA-binding domain-containing protein [Bacteroidales bacterium]
MFQFLNKPYPFNDDLKHNSKIIFFICLGIFGFLYLFQPLDVSAIANRQKVFVILGLGVVTFLSLSLNLLMFPSLFPKIFLKRVWTIKKEILWDIWIFSTISVGYYLYFKAIGIFEIDFYLIVKLIAIAVVPIAGLITINYNRMLRSHVKLLNGINTKLNENKSKDEQLVHFKSDYTKDSLSIKVNLLLFIRAANNYIEIFWKENEHIKSQMVRTSLKKAEDILTDYKFIFKCHRSFLINTNFIDKVEGSIQGYKLFVDKIDFSIPVSKNFAYKLKELI